MHMWSLLPAFVRTTACMLNKLLEWTETSVFLNSKHTYVPSGIVGNDDMRACPICRNVTGGVPLCQLLIQQREGPRRAIIGISAHSCLTVPVFIGSVYILPISATG